MDIIYEVDDTSRILSDLTLLVEGLRLLEYDYIGGSGSRGYGKVKFRDLHADNVVGEIDAALMDQCNELFKVL